MGCGQLHGALISSPLLRHDPLAQALLATALRTDDVFFKQNAEIAGYIQVEAGNIAFKFGGKNHDPRLSRFSRKVLFPY